jgi:excisionase family DNA binding protein
MTSSTFQHGPRAAHSIAETCALTGLGRDSIYSAIRSGKLLARKLGKRTLVTDDDLRQFLAGLPRAGEPSGGTPNER